jgi:hypothetical protein
MDWIEDPDGNRPPVDRFRDPYRSLIRYGCTIIEDCDAPSYASRFEKGKDQSEYTVEVR